MFNRDKKNIRMYHLYAFLRYNPIISKQYLNTL